MKSILIASALAAVSIIPSCPAPPAFPFIVGGAVAGAVGGGVAEIIVNNPSVGGRARSLMRYERRQIDLPPGVSQHAFDECTQSMAGITISVTVKPSNTFQIDAVPAPCMNLATLFVGQGAHAVPCGSACLTYDNLSDADAQLLWGAIDVLKNSS